MFWTRHRLVQVTALLDLMLRPPPRNGDEAALFGNVCRDDRGKDGGSRSLLGDTRLAQGFESALTLG
jgi:hypothetical protein